MGHMHATVNQELDVWGYHEIIPALGGVCASDLPHCGALSQMNLSRVGLL